MKGRRRPSSSSTSTGTGHGPRCRTVGTERLRCVGRSRTRSRANRKCCKKRPSLFQPLATVQVEDRLAVRVRQPTGAWRTATRGGQCRGWSKTRTRAFLPRSIAGGGLEVQLPVEPTGYRSRECAAAAGRRRVGSAEPGDGGAPPVDTGQRSFSPGEMVRSAPSDRARSDVNGPRSADRIAQSRVRTAFGPDLANVD